MPREEKVTSLFETAASVIVGLWFLAMVLLLVIISITFLVHLFF